VHQSDEGKPTPGRPSQFPPNQSGDPSRPRVVGGLDRIDETVTPFSPAARFPWLLSAALLLAIGAGAVLLSGTEAEKQIVRVGTEPLPEPPPVLSEDACQDPMLDDAPLPLIVREPIHAAAAPPAPERRVASVSVPKKPAAKRKVLPPAPPKKAPAVQKPAQLSQSERDVALLAAVVTRSKASADGPAILSVKWKQCGGASSVAAARQCRVRLCATAGTQAGECAALRRDRGKSRS
jgi:hypothetical protein